MKRKYKLQPRWEFPKFANQGVLFNHFQVTEFKIKDLVLSVFTVNITFFIKFQRRILYSITEGIDEINPVMQNYIITVALSRILRNSIHTKPKV
jgi:hypothetical protein